MRGNNQENNDKLSNLACVLRPRKILKTEANVPKPKKQTISYIQKDDVRNFADDMKAYMDNINKPKSKSKNKSIINSQRIPTEKSQDEPKEIKVRKNLIFSKLLQYL